ncbi:hypothetical protein GGR56DRAFT_127681 [Xylariaceae sp. FL0804]|nr:hypothetical protein GGR56DRAFT_127681 [Xylariaceae sp. FL0804]
MEFWGLKRAVRALAGGRTGQGEHEDALPSGRCSVERGSRGSARPRSKSSLKEAPYRCHQPIASFTKTPTQCDPHAIECGRRCPKRRLPNFVPRYSVPLSRKESPADRICIGKTPWVSGIGPSCSVPNRATSSRLLRTDLWDLQRSGSGCRHTGAAPLMLRSNQQCKPQQRPQPSPFGFPRGCHPSAVHLHLTYASPYTARSNA